MKFLQVTMPDGSRWAVRVEVIARHRAEHYKHEFGDNVERSLLEDTLPLFKADQFECTEWAANNMNWCDVADVAVRMPDANKPEPDYEEGWMNGPKQFIELP